LVDLFELYDDAWTYKLKVDTNLCQKILPLV